MLYGVFSVWISFTVCGPVVDQLGHSIRRWAENPAAEWVAPKLLEAFP